MTDQDQKNEIRERWGRYYQLSIDWLPRGFLQKTLPRFETAGLAIDLGCGTGTDTLFLLQNGWQVLAVDAQPSAFEALHSRVPDKYQKQLETRIASFESIELPPADLIWAGNSLPFCHPDHFSGLWDKIHDALRPDGRFAGDFFGPRHAWRSHESMNFFSKEELMALIAGWNLEYMAEEEGQQLTALGGYQYWHAFTICAQKRPPKNKS